MSNLKIFACPVCAHELSEPTEMIVLLRFGLVKRGDKEIYLPNLEMRFFSECFEKYCEVVSQETIIHALWRYNPPDNFLNSVKVFRHRIDRKLEKIGLALRSVKSDCRHSRESGYLVMPREARVAEILALPRSNLNPPSSIVIG